MLFPMFFTPQPTGSAALPLYQDVEMDYKKGTPKWQGGQPNLCTGAQAVKSWAWRALRTARYQYSVFSWSYACELEQLIGQPYTADTKVAEAERYVKEALLVCPYIRQVQVRNVHFEGDTLHMDVSIDTVYGEVDLDV